MSADISGQIVYRVCEVCGGTPKRLVGFPACRSCGNTGIYYALGKDRLYWSYGLDVLHIIVRKWNRIIERALDGLLFVLLVINIFVLFQLGLSFQFEPLAWVEALMFGTQGLVGLFWFLLVFNTYLFYRIYHKLISRRDTIDYTQRDNQRSVNIAQVLSPRLVDLLDATWSEVAHRRQMPIRPLQIFRQLLSDQDVRMILARLGISMQKLATSVDRQIAYYPLIKAHDALSNEVHVIMLNAYVYAYQDRVKHIRATDLLLATVRADQIIQEILYDSQVSLIKVENVVKWVNFNNELIARYQRYRARSAYRPKGPVNRAYTAAATPYLDSFSTDLTLMARVGQLSFSVAREKEIEEIFRVMEGGKSVVLVGENGVGKFNIIEGLANRMVAEEVPPLFQDKRLINLSLPFLVAGAGRTGEVQERLLLVIQEIVRSGNIIIVVEDIHNLVGVSSAGTENIDLSEVLAQEIHAGSVRVIATTTPSDMTEYVERGALGGVLERIPVPEPGANQAIQILEANVGMIEAQYKVFFTYAALEEIVNLSDRYLHDQFLPVKAINLLTEAASWASQRESKLITSEDIASIVSRKTNIPLTQVTKEESSVLMNLEQIMHERIIGQEEAVKLVVSALRRARTEPRDEKRPIVNLLFLGPTGVGKTELAKTVAASYFGDEQAMIRLDMSEYQQQDSIARLLGAPGSNRGGILTEQVRHHPFSLLLLDEIEKAHPDILNIFLQVMDDGRLTDALGRTVDFTNIILVATSNAQANFIQDEVRKNTPIDQIKNILVREKLRDSFRPEFLNRFDGVVVFKPLMAEEIFQIAGLLLGKVRNRLENKGIALLVTPEAQRELAEAGFDPVFGARPLRRVIQERVEEALANYLLKGEIGRRDQVIFDQDGRIEVKKAQQL